MLSPDQETDLLKAAYLKDFALPQPIRPDCKTARAEKSTARAVVLN